MRPRALLHHGRDFAAIAAIVGVTGQALRWYGPDRGALALQASPARGSSSAETPRVTVR